MGATSFSDRLNLLFAAFLAPRNERGVRKEWTNAQVTRAAEAVYGRKMFDAETLRQARKGPMVRGTRAEVAGAIARAFEFLSGDDPTPGTASAIVSYLCIDPDDPDVKAEDIATLDAIDQQLRTAIDLRETTQSNRFELLTRINSLADDPESRADIEAFVKELEAGLHRKRRGRRS